MQSTRQLSPTSILAVGISLFVAASAPAQADEADSFNINLSESYAHDNNLFRLADGVDPASVGLSQSKRSDNIRTDSIGLTYDKQYSLQHFHLGARVDHFEYTNYDFLNYDSKNFDGRWDWSLTPHITGELAADRSEVLNSFADYQTYQRNIRTTDKIRFRSELGSIGTVRFVVGASQSKTSNSELIQQDGDSRNRAAQAGLRYVGEAGSTFGYWYRQNRLEWTDRELNYLFLYDTNANQTDHELYGTLRLSDQTALDGAITRVDREHEHFAERDYTGTAGRLNFNWTPETTLRIGLFAKRDYGTWWTLNTNYVITDSYGLTARWQISQKIAMSGRLEHGERKFRGDLLLIPASTRSDKTDQGQLGLDWEPIRNLFLGLNLMHSRRSSNEAGHDYNDTTTSMQARMVF